MKLSLRIALCLLIMSIGAIFVSSAELQNSGISKGKLLYEDNFSSSKFGAFVGGQQDNNVSVYFGDGRYHIEVVPLDMSYTASYGSEYNNTIFEVEATQESGPDDNFYGVAFRKVDWNNYYQFLISGDGYYRIEKKQDSKWVFATPWKKSSAIHTGSVTNIIDTVCNGEKFSFYVNNIKVDDYTDSSFGSGMIGFVAGSEYSKGPVIIGFDNLKIWQIAQ